MYVFKREKWGKRRVLTRMHGVEDKKIWCIQLKYVVVVACNFVHRIQTTPKTHCVIWRCRTTFWVWPDETELLGRVWTSFTSEKRNRDYWVRYIDDGSGDDLILHVMGFKDTTPMHHASPHSQNRLAHQMSFFCHLSFPFFFFFLMFLFSITSLLFIF